MQTCIVFIYFSDDEMFSDSYEMKLVDGVMYEVYGKVFNKDLVVVVELSLMGCCLSSMCRESKVRS